jgi:hypothetical protein
MYSTECGLAGDDSGVLAKVSLALELGVQQERNDDKSIHRRAGQIPRVPWESLLPSLPALQQRSVR